VASMHDEPDVAAPAARSRRQVDRGAVAWAVRRLESWITTKMEITVARVAARPMAGPRGKRAELFGGRLAWVGEGGCLGARQAPPRDVRMAGTCRRRLGAPAGLNGARDGSLLDLGNCDRSDGHEAAHKGDGAGDAACAILPAPDGPRGDGEQFGSVAWREAERAECRAEFGRSRR